MDQLVVPLTQGECHIAIGEVIRLIRAAPLTVASQQRLNLLLLSYFQDDDAGNSFRSMACLGSLEYPVSLETFNKIVIQPVSHYEIQLAPPANHVPIQLQLVPTDARRILFQNMLAHAHLIVDFVLHHTIKQHRDSSNLLALCPNNIPAAWKNAIIGKLDRSVLKIVDLPSLIELKIRIQISLDYALDLKRTNVRAHFYTTQSGSAWHQISLEDSFNISDLYLKACSSFPKYLGNLLEQKGTTIDKLAGVEPAGQYPEVEAIIRDGFSRASTSGVEFHDMHLDDGSLGGTVFGLHNGCLSPEWLASYLVDTDNNYFMPDRRAKLKNDKERLLRVYSNYHSFHVPTWLQFGEQKDIYLYLSQRASAAEEGWLKIANFIIKLEIDHINSFLDTIPGTKQYRIDPVDHKLDAGLAVCCDPSLSSFAGHTDCKTGLTHPSVPGYSRFFLQVMTLAIANFESKSSHITWFLHDDKDEKPKAKLSQDFVLLHCQLMAVNVNFKHKVSCTLPKGEIDPKLLLQFQLNRSDRNPDPTGLPTQGPHAVLHLPHFDASSSPTPHEAPNSMRMYSAKRLTNSARKTQKLQQIALLEYHQKLDRDRQDGPLVFGSPTHYNRLCCWGSQDAASHMGLGVVSGPTASYFTQSSLNDSPAPTVDDSPLLLSSLLRVTAEPETLAKPSSIISVDFSRYVYLKRTSDKALWPPPNTKLISSRKSLAETVSGGQVSKLLAAKGIIPVIVSPNPHNNTNSIRTRFGPLLDENHQPVIPGTCFNENELYPLFRMKKAVDHHDVWLPSVWLSNCVMLRLAEKNGTSIQSELIIDGPTPLGEVQRVCSEDHERQGFEIYGSGGNPVVTGLVLPNSKGKVGGDGATYESCQTIANKLNQTMELHCERGTPIVVVLAGEGILPQQYHDVELQKKLGPGDCQAMYLGMYRVMRGAQEEVSTADQIAERVVVFQKFYPNLDETQMRFHLEPCKKYILVPLDYYTPIPGGYRHLEADTRDPRKPLTEVPRKTSYNRCLSLKNPYSQRQLFDDWIANDGHLELLHSPFESSTTKADESSIFRTVQPLPSERSTGYKMAVFAKRRQTFKDHWNILLNAAVASASRQLKVHIDADLRIGPLIDSVSVVHTGKSELPQYLKYISPSSNTTPYLSFLGPEVQKSPTTHPIRTYDPKVLLLFENNGGGSKRATRLGLTFMEDDATLATDLFFQCIVVETVKVQVLLEWSRLNRTTGSEAVLPTLQDIPEFLSFIDSILNQLNATSTSPITPDQYELNPSFHNRQCFNRFFTHLGTMLQPWLRRQVRWARQQLDTTKDIFQEANNRLTAFISSLDSGIEPSTKQPFQTQHILMDFNELVAEFPLGVPKCPVVGFGGSFGAQLLQDDTFSISKPQMVEKVMSQLLRQYADQDKASLQVLGLLKLDEGRVVIAINGRPLTVCEPEHCCCIQYFVVERRAGGSKGLSNEPKLSSTYCHPIPHSTFQEDIAISTLLQFREMVDDGVWLGPDQVDLEPNETKDGADDEEVEADQSADAADDEEVEAGGCDEKKAADNRLDSIDDDDHRFNDDLDSSHEDDRSDDNIDSIDEDDRFNDDAVNDNEDDTNDVKNHDNAYRGCDDENMADNRVASMQEEDRFNDDNVNDNDDDSNDVTNHDNNVADDRVDSIDGDGDYNVDLANDDDLTDSKCGVHQAITWNETYSKRATNPWSLPHAKRPKNKLHELTSQSSNISHHPLVQVDKRSPERQCNLMLGMIYGDLPGTIQEIGRLTNCSPQLRRDTARCLSTEICRGKDVYTLDNRPPLGARTDRHIDGSMSKIIRYDPLILRLSGHVSQICLDHFWFSDTYWVEKAITDSFFTKSLPILWDLLHEDGVIYLGLSAGIFTQVIRNESAIKLLYEISLVHSDDVGENDLVAGSHNIPDELYRCPNTFGNKDLDPERELGFSIKHLRDKGVGQGVINHYVSRLGQLVDQSSKGTDAREFRFVKLSKIV